MDIAIKTKFSPGDKVVVKTINDTEKLPVFVLAEVKDVARIVRYPSGINIITYEAKTFNISGCYNRNIVVEEADMYTFEEFTEMFNALQPTKPIKAIS